MQNGYSKIVKRIFSFKQIKQALIQLHNSSTLTEIVIIYVKMHVKQNKC